MEYRSYDPSSGQRSPIPPPPPNAFDLHVRRAAPSVGKHTIDKIAAANQGIEVVDGIGEAPSGATRVTFTVDPVTGAPAQSAIGMHQVPWQSEQPGAVPPKATTLTSQVHGGAVDIGVQSQILD